MHSPMNTESIPLASAVSTIISPAARVWVAALVAVAIGYLAIKKLRVLVFGKTQPVSYPPGPPREFLIGSLRSFPSGIPTERFREWAMIYGDIVYAPVPGTEIVILNSYEVVQELLSKRPGSTAGRDVGYLASSLMGWGWQLAFLQPGPSHSIQRKMLWRSIGPQGVASHDAVIEATVMKVMNRLNTFFKP